MSWVLCLCSCLLNLTLCFIPRATEGGRRDGGVWLTNIPSPFFQPDISYWVSRFSNMIYHIMPTGPPIHGSSSRKGVPPDPVRPGIRNMIYHNLYIPAPHILSCSCRRSCSDGIRYIFATPRGGPSVPSLQTQAGGPIPFLGLPHAS